MPMEFIYILLIALGLDLILGEPPAFIHPVVWMGQVIAFLIKAGRSQSQLKQLVWGITVVLIVVCLFAIPTYFFLDYLRTINFILYLFLAGAIFKTSFSLKGLAQAGLKIRDLLLNDKLAEARFEVRALVGRDTRELGKNQLVSATIESIAENACDSFFAPLFFFLFLGVPGAIGYRVINTLDSMIGHHGDYEYLGKFAARLDTVVNFIPARFTALTIVGASWICSKKSSQAWEIMIRDRGNTESPNAGWTMAAMAGALQVQLEKVGFYKLGDRQGVLTTSKIDDSLKIIITASICWTLFLILLRVIYHVAA